MKENLHDLDKLFRAAFDDHEELPSAGVWEAIDQQLDRNKVIEIKRKYIRLRKIAVGLFVTLVGTGIYTWSTLKTANEQAGKDGFKNNAQNNAVAAVDQAQQHTGKIIASNTINAGSNHGVEGSKKIKGRMEADQNGPGIPAGIARNPALANSTGQTGSGLLKTPEYKVITGKGNQKTIITNADHNQADYGTVTSFRGKKEIKVNRNLAILPAINPEIIKGEPASTIKRNFSPGSQALSRDFITPAQTGQTTKTGKPATFTATIFFAPSISFNRIKDGKRKSQSWRPDDNWDKIRNGEQHQFSSTFGVLIDYNINNHWGLQSGITLSNKTIRINPKTIYADLDNNGSIRYLYNCSSGYLFLSSKSVTNPALGDSIQAFESTNTLQYATIPLAVKYNYSIKKVDLFVSLGASINILTMDKIETGIEDGPNKEVSITKKINGLQPDYFGAVVSMGASYNVSPKVALSFLPAYNFALTSSTKDAMVKTYPSTISLAAGIRYKL